MDEMTGAGATGCTTMRAKNDEALDFSGAFVDFGDAGC